MNLGCMVEARGRVRTNLGEARSLDEVVEFAQSGVSWQRLNVQEQVLFLRLKQLPVVGNQQGLGPERADVHAHHLELSLHRLISSGLTYLLSTINQAET